MASRNGSSAATTASKQRACSGDTRQRSSAHRLVGQDIAGVTSVIEASELTRIKNRAVILTDSDLQHRRQDHDLQLSATRHESDERKRRMMEKELAVRARREQAAMDAEIEAEKQALLTPEDVQRHQHLVSIRRIQSLALQATGYQLCDELQQHKETRNQREQRYERIHDSIMERDRITDLEIRKERDAAAHAKRMEARAMLEQQIHERQKRAIWDEEAKAIEAQKIVQTYKQYEADEQQQRSVQQEQRRVLRQDVVRTNARIQATKDAAIARERHEEVVAAAYLQTKALEEEAAVKEAQRLRRAKEVRVAKLRAQQEKAQDKQAALDDTRAKKASEETERRMRAKEKHERETQRALMQTIQCDRERHAAFHNTQQQHERLVEHRMDALAQQHVEQEAAQQRIAHQAAHDRNVAHGRAVQQQIELNAARRVKATLFARDDTHNKKTATRESIIAEKVRCETLERLERQGVPEEYLRELKSMQITESNA